MGELKPAESAADLLPAAGVRPRPVPVPEWGRTLYLRPLSALEIIESTRRSAEIGADKPAGEQDQAKLMALTGWLLSRAVVTADGRPYLSEADADNLCGVPGNFDVVNRLVEDIVAQAKMRESDRAELKKDSPPTPSNGSPSASPTTSASGTSTGGW